MSKIVPPREAFVIERCGPLCPSHVYSRDYDRFCAKAGTPFSWEDTSKGFPDFCQLEDAK